MKLARFATVAPVVLALTFSVTTGILMLTDSSQADVELQTDAPRIAAAARGRIEIEGGLSRILATLDGQVESVLVAEGQRVEAGDVLAKLVSRDAEFVTAAAEAALKEAKSRQAALESRRVMQARLLDRMRRAAKEQAVSPQALDEAQAAMAALTGDLGSAEAAVALATAKRDGALYELERRQIRAPLPGRVARRSVKTGDVVSATMPTEMFVVIPDAPLIVRAEIQENFVRLVKPGMVAEIVSESDERMSAKGKVLRVGAFLDNRRAGESPTERADVRVAESVVQLDAPDAFLIGQRVYVRFRNP
ncbi:efflux RND transporter periplasmic adaptor subunit [Chelatococcus asaccharovorans]|uniref:RND family efflux transporter MFP subunit n=1 Tax=Chelatococcus asaccharovorans TaxID=28210 RepID=A0A2V3UIH3_9HYPH|nr:HlyD family efflux transporter periplasmic adaptor subunit [Chelatococcus asaccharovorans]MBS7706253.1 HlyD family efflux transporter periplasmic adaptor subunit [Chelatococcus asaccharovorans]PXW65111.1 RND family efflux transporter MFP subunit [Chelatococcus asaccharovorans]